jgi:hypothetical protein
MFLKMSVAASERWRALKQFALRDRGEGPVPYLLMVGVIAIGAIAIATVVVTVANGLAEDLPTEAPDPLP